MYDLDNGWDRKYIKEQFRKLIFPCLGKDTSLVRDDFLRRIFGLQELGRMIEYEKKSWWEFLKKYMSELRKEGIIFPIIDKFHRVYVPCNKAEVEDYKECLKKFQNNITIGQTRADKWLLEGLKDFQVLPKQFFLYCNLGIS